MKRSLYVGLVLVGLASWMLLPVPTCAQEAPQAGGVSQKEPLPESPAPTKLTEQAEPNQAVAEVAAEDEVDASSHASAARESASEETPFLRLHSVDEQPQSLDTAIVTYRADTVGGVEIDLIGAVHIGEASYYAELNRLFDTYDVVLYELVAPEGTQLPRGGPRESGFNPVAMLQDGAKTMLGLESQLEKVDYTKGHFVRADMTPTQIAEKMAQRGDTAMTLALDTLADVMRQQNLAARQPDVDRPVPGIDPDVSLADMLGNPLKMKRLLAEQFASAGSLDQALGRSLNQLLIVDRNAEALKGVQKQIAAGKKKIGIFYGAAHLPDLEKHLVEDFGLEKKSHRWLAAWDLTTARKPKLSEPVGLLLNVLKALE